MGIEVLLVFEQVGGVDDDYWLLFVFEVGGYDGVQYVCLLYGGFLVQIDL